MLQAAPTRQDDDLAPGELFADRYKIEGLLGRGGMGAVYQARDLSLGEPIAIKVLSLGADAPPLAVLRFRQEVKLARRVTHPNVARVYDIGEHAGVIYLTMELVEGSTLRAVLERERRLAPPRVAQIAQEIAGALRAAHDAGVIHRDIKPTNILIDRAGKVMLTDFGIARSRTDASELTEGAIGTPRYMAPEQKQSGKVDPRTDLYTLGLCLYEMLTGRRAEDTADMLAEEMRKRGAPPALVALTLRCLERSPEARPASAAEVERALAKITALPALEPTTQDAPLEALSSAETATTAPTSTTPTAPASDAPRTDQRPHMLAVLPFLCWGDQEAEHISAAIADEIVDGLSSLCSRVLGTRSTAEYRHEPDLRSMRDALGVSVVVDGTVQLLASRVRINVRLVDAETNAQIWSVAHEGIVGDLFAFQAAIGQQIAEQLRVEITTLTYGGDAPAEAIKHYLSALSKLRGYEYTSASAAAQEFERCIQLAPGFTPALAGYAMASSRAWFFAPGYPGAPDWERAATRSVARAQKRAPKLAETHVAAGMLALQSGEYVAAARALTEALALAPTCAEAHLALGELECESGQIDSGVKHLKRALTAAPELTSATILLARQYALEGRFAECDRTLTQLEEQGMASASRASMIRVRTAAWRGDREALGWFAAGKHRKHLRLWEFVRLYAQGALGVIEAEEIDRRFATLSGPVTNVRRSASLTQLTAEVFAFRGELEAAMLHLFRAASLSLIDLTWLDLCPLFAALRALPDFAVVRQRVQARIEATWQP